MTKNKKAYEELIKAGVDAELSSVKEVITDEEVLEMGYPLPPEGVLDKAKETYEAKKAAEKSKKHVNIRKIFLIAAVLIIMSVAVAISTTGYKKYQQNSSEKIEDNAIRLTGTNDASYTCSAEESAVYESAEKIMNVSLLKPTYLPDGFIYDSTKLRENIRIITTYTNQNITIRLTQSLLENSYTTNETIDDTNEEIYSINALGTTISVKKHTQDSTDSVWLNATWYGQEVMYRVDSNCSREEFNKFIENLR